VLSLTNISEDLGRMSLINLFFKVILITTFKIKVSSPW